MSKVGLVLEGGSFRGIFTAGVLDYMLEQNIDFSYVIGVSAGAGNAASYISKQSGRIKRVIMQEDASPYYGLPQLLKSGKMLDTNKLTFGYAYNDIPFDFDTFFQSQTECEFVATNCRTGKPEYLQPEDSEERLLTLMQASCSLPFICKPVKIGESYYLDGSLSDSIPFEYVLNEHCDKVVVVLTRRYETEPPTDYAQFGPLINLQYKKQYPGLADVLVKRKENYEKQMRRLFEYESKGLAYIIRPDGMSIGHFEKDKEKLEGFYNHGKEIMEKHLAELRDFMVT